MENETNIVIITFSQQQDDFTRCNNKINKNVKLSLDTGHSLYSYKYTIRLFSLVNKSKNCKHEWYTVKIITNIFQVRTALIWPNFDQIHTSCMNSFDSTYEKAYFVYISYKVTYSFWKKPKTNLKNYLKIYYPCIEDVLKWYSLTWNWIIIQIFSYIIFSYNVVQLLVF